jgi:hypothetical protein
MKALVLESYNNLMVKEVPQPVYNEKRFAHPSKSMWNLWQ